MRAGWEALHTSLVRSVRSLTADKNFNTLKEIESGLRRFTGPIGLLDFLTSKGGSLDDKDDIYRALVTVAQRGDPESELATSLLWLGLWPGLDAVFRRALGFYFAAPEELVSDIGDRFTYSIHRADLSRIRRVAATLTRNTERDVRNGRLDERDEQARRAEMPSDDCAVLADTHPEPDAASTLGLMRGLPPAREIAAIRDWLTPIVGADADLVIGAAIYGEHQSELGDRLGITHAAARKRFQRAIKRIRQRLEEEQ